MLSACRSMANPNDILSCKLWAVSSLQRDSLEVLPILAETSRAPPFSSRS